MKKDGNASIRINKEILALIKARGLSVQKIVDKWIKRNVKVKNEVKSK